MNLFFSCQYETAPRVSITQGAVLFCRKQFPAFIPSYPVLIILGSDHPWFRTSLVLIILGSDHP
jgi:hypothetical protein